MWIHNDLIVACNRREKLFLVKLIYWTEHIVKRSFTAQCTDDFLHGPYKNQLVLDLNTKCGSELLYVRCELAKFATTIISIIFFPSHFCEQKKLFSSPHHLLFYNASYKGNILHNIQHHFYIMLRSKFSAEREIILVGRS